MPGVFTLETREFNSALREILKTSSRDHAVVLNSRAWWYCKYAIRFTKKSNRWAVEKQLLGKNLVRTKSGRISNAKSANNFGEDTYAARIINIGRKPQLHGSELSQAIRKLIAARNRSIGFIASGWGWAQDILKNAWNKPESIGGRSEGVKWGGKQKKGGATPARSTANNFMPYALVRNSALITKSRRGDVSDPHPVAVVGAEKALAKSIKDMKKHLEKKFKAMANKHNGRSL